MMDQNGLFTPLDRISYLDKGRGRYDGPFPCRGTFLAWTLNTEGFDFTFSRDSAWLVVLRCSLSHPTLMVSGSQTVANFV